MGTHVASSSNIACDSCFRASRSAATIASLGRAGLMAPCVQYCVRDCTHLRIPGLRSIQPRTSSTTGESLQTQNSSSGAITTTAHLPLHLVCYTSNRLFILFFVCAAPAVVDAVADDAVQFLVCNPVLHRQDTVDLVDPGISYPSSQAYHAKHLKGNFKRLIKKS